MNKVIFGVVLAGLLLAEGALAAPLKAELVMPGGKSWKGAIVGRDGEWIEFSTGRSPRPIRIGVSTIEALNFDVTVDAEKLAEMKRKREFERIISALERVLKPYAEYGDIPSNLNKYNALIMELSYQIGDYEKCLALADALANDARDPALQEKSRIFQALSLIDAGRAADAEVLLEKYGWDKEVSDDSPPEKLYIVAKLMGLKKEYNRAMELVAKVIAFNSQNTQWMQPAELLCAELYTELGASNPLMYDSAEQVIHQISLLYKDTVEYDKSQELKIKIEKLRAEMELKKSLESEEA
jgi:tetratricopeptide (TPR) repeat protein